MFYINKANIRHIKIMFDWWIHIKNRKYMLDNKKFSYSEHKTTRNVEEV